MVLGCLLRFLLKCIGNYYNFFPIKKTKYTICVTSRLNTNFKNSFGIFYMFEICFRNPWQSFN